MDEGIKSNRELESIKKESSAYSINKNIVSEVRNTLDEFDRTQHSQS